MNKLKGKVREDLLALMPEAFAKYEVNTHLRAAHFLGQVAHESGDFRKKTESLFYSKPEQIVKTWPTRFNLDGSGGKKNASEYIKNQEKLAAAVYDNRKELGNDEPGDGFRFRGGGFLQLTGKVAYAGYAKYIGKSVGETADLLRSNDHFALDGALWNYVLEKKLNVVADTGAGDDVVKTISKRVNGGKVGMEERIVLFHKFYELLSAPVTA